MRNNTYQREPVEFAEPTEEISYAEVLKRIKEASEELEAYRALGTVEELQAIKASTALVTDILAEYSSIGTIELFKALKEKAEQG